MPEPTPILLVADDPLVRSGLAALLPEEVAVARAVSTSADLAEAVRRSGAAAVLWDAGEARPDRASLDLGVPVVLLVREPLDEPRGAAGVLSRDADPGRLYAALLAVCAGLEVRDPAVCGPPAPVALAEPPLAEPLTPRELEVLALLAEGRSNREIGLALEISPHTAKFHVDRILLKLEASSRTDAVVRAVRLGLMTL